MPQGMEPGTDFEEVIEGTVARCEVLLAVIGRDWLAPGPDGARRLDGGPWTGCGSRSAYPTPRRRAARLGLGPQATHLLDGLERALGTGHATLMAVRLPTKPMIVHGGNSRWDHPHAALRETGMVHGRPSHHSPDHPYKRAWHSPRPPYGYGQVGLLERDPGHRRQNIHDETPR